MRNIFVLLFVISAFTSCDNCSEKREKEIKDLLFQQSVEWNNGDIEAYMSFYWKSDSLRFASGDRVTYGWTQTLKNYKKAYPNKQIMGNLVFSKIDVDLLDGNNALVFGRWHLKRETDEPHGLFTLNLRKFSDGWKIVSDHTSAAN